MIKLFIANSLVINIDKTHVIKLIKIVQDSLHYVVGPVAQPV
jgi:hypothetical protein